MSTPAAARVVNPQDFKRGMRQLAAAVSVITAEHGGQRAGMTATSVSSLTAEPPQIGVAINRTNASYAAVVGSRRFAVNVLSHEQAEVAASFAGMLGLQGQARFGAAAAEWGTLATGAPVLAGAAASFDCELVQEVELSSHVLMVGLVRAVAVTPTATPLLFMDGTWASLVRADLAALDSYEAIVGRVEATLDAALAATNDPARQFAGFVKGFADIYAAEVPALRHFFSQHAIAPASRLDALAARKRALEAVVLDLLRRGRAGGPGLPDPAIASQAIFGMFGSIHRWPADPAWQPEAVSGTLQVLAAALAGTAGTPRPEDARR